LGVVLPSVPKVDEFAFVLLAGLLFIIILAFVWTTPSQGPPFVEETHFDIIASRGSTKTFDFTIKSTEGLTSVNITAAGEIAKWMTFNKNDFDVASDDSTIVTATLKIPYNISDGTYSGRVNIKSAGGSDSFSVSLDIGEGGEEVSKRPISLGDFSVSYTQGTDIVDSRREVSVTNGLFSSRSITLSGVLTSEKLSIVTGGSIHLVIDDTNQAGSLIVSINNNEIYNQKVSAGEVFIPIDKGLIEASNTVKIKAGSPGMQFWTSTVYDILIAEFNVDYDGAFSKEFNITMSKNEVDNFKQFNLFYRVKDYNTPLSEMMIKVNNQIVYWDSPPLALFDMDLDEDMFGNPLYLQEGTNTISFMFEEEAYYNIADTMLYIEYYV
jgi:hypothetical protein